MSICKITPSEIAENSVASLPTSPSSPSLYRGKTYSAAELRAAFDRLPLLLAERYNGLFDSLGINRTEAERFAELIATGISEEHSLEDLFRDIESGAFSAYLSTADGDTLAKKAERFSDLEASIGNAAYEGATLTAAVAILQRRAAETTALLGAEAFTGTLKERINENTEKIESAAATAESALSLAEGKSRGRSYGSWAEVISAMKGYATVDAARKDFSIGDSLYTLDKSSDAWVYGFAESSSFPPVPDYDKDPFGEESTVQVGFTILARVAGNTDLSGYVKSTDVATSYKAGIVKAGSGLSVAEDGTLSVKKTDASTCANALYDVKTGDHSLLLRGVSPIAGTVTLKAISKNAVENTGSTTVTVYGKNLLRYPYTNSLGEHHGCTISDGGNGTIIANGNPSQTFVFFLSMDAQIKANVTYTFSINADKPGAPQGTLQLRTKDGNLLRVVASDNGDGAKIMLSESDLANGNRVWPTLLFTVGQSYENIVIKPQLEIGPAATDYEPYIQPTQIVVPFGEEVNIPALSPNMTISADRGNTKLTATYQRDLNQAFRSVASRTEALLMKSGERGFGFTKLPSAIGTHTAKDDDGNSVSLTLADSEDGFSMTVDVVASTDVCGLSLRIPIATFETEAGKSYTIPALPDKTAAADGSYCSMSYSVGGTFMNDNFIVTPGWEPDGMQSGYYGAQEYLSDGGTKTLYLNFSSTAPFRAYDILSMLAERTVTLPLPDMGYEITVKEETVYTTRSGASNSENTLKLTPIENGLHVSCTHNLILSSDPPMDEISFEVQIASINVQEGLYYTVPALAENTATSNPYVGRGAYFMYEINGATKDMRENFHPSNGGLGNYGVDNFQAPFTGTLGIYLVLKYAAGVSDDVARDFDLTFPLVSTSGNLTLAPEGGTEYRLDVATAATLQLAFPKHLAPESIFHTKVCFDTAVATPSVSYPNTFVFAGDDVTDGVFAPGAQKRYRIALDYDGEKLLGDVRAYPM